MVPELIPIRGSQPADDVSHKPGGRLPLLSTRPAVTPATLKRAAGVNSLPKTVTRQRRGCDLNPALLRLSPARQPLGYTEPPKIASFTIFKEKNMIKN